MNKWLLVGLSLLLLLSGAPSSAQEGGVGCLLGTDCSSGSGGPDFGTLTDTKFCVYDLAGTEVVCGSDAAPGDVTDVLGCTGADCDSITMTDDLLLDMSAVDVSDGAEGLILPQGGAACTGALAAGQVCWDETLDDLWVGDGTGGPTQVNADAVAPARGSFVVCGDADTIATNTVYYGPDLTNGSIGAMPGGLECDTTAAGNTTEATADEYVYKNHAFDVVSMTCRQDFDAAANIVYALRDDEGPTIPSVTCTILDDEYECVSVVRTTTSIAANSKVAISGTAGAGIGNVVFVCDVEVEF